LITLCRVGVFAAIERYKVLSVEYTAAVDRRAPLEDDDPDLFEAEDEASRTGAALFAQMDRIFSYRPATVAGVAALLKYISTLEDWQMPQGWRKVRHGGGAEALHVPCRSDRTERGCGHEQHHRIPRREQVRLHVRTKSEPRNMTGVEFAALVARMPITDQEMILKIAGQLAKGRP
jgi:hypothetical protein